MDYIGEHLKPRDIRSRTIVAAKKKQVIFHSFNV